MRYPLPPSEAALSGRNASQGFKSYTVPSAGPVAMMDSRIDNTRYRDEPSVVKLSSLVGSRDSTVSAETSADFGIYAEAVLAEHAIAGSMMSASGESCHCTAS
jgi:hypothetical protein